MHNYGPMYYNAQLICVYAKLFWTTLLQNCYPCISNALHLKHENTQKHLCLCTIIIIMVKADLGVLRCFSVLLLRWSKRDAYLSCILTTPKANSVFANDRLFLASA